MTRELQPMQTKRAQCFQTLLRDIDNELSKTGAASVILERYDEEREVIDDHFIRDVVAHYRRLGCHVTGDVYEITVAARLVAP
jgi:hypothetical protein